MSGATDLSKTLLPSVNMNCTDTNSSEAVKRMQEDASAAACPLPQYSLTMPVSLPLCQKEQFWISASSRIVYLLDVEREWEITV